MAHSKSGGTRAYIRGKIGADVYSIGKNGKGQKQQVVRSLAEQVSNPQTEAQMRGRMIMSTIMQAQSAMRAIVDHSFDGVPAGMPSLAKFTSENYALIKADVLAHPATGNAFGLNKYQEKGIKNGVFVISSGKLILSSLVSVAVATGVAKVLITDVDGTHTAGAYRDALGLSIGDYFTVCLVANDTQGNNQFSFARFKLTGTLSAATTITSGNVAQLFEVETYVPSEEDIAFESNKVQITWPVITSTQVAVILSKKEGDTWVHNTATLSAVTNPTYAADDALPTYPQGAGRFINGGEL